MTNKPTVDPEPDVEKPKVGTKEHLLERVIRFAGEFLNSRANLKNRERDLAIAMSVSSPDREFDRLYREMRAQEVEMARTELRFVEYCVSRVTERGNT